MYSTTQQFVSALRVFVQSRVRSERGATAVEYGLLVALIAIAIIVGVTALAGGLNGIFNSSAGSLDVAN